MVDSGHEIVFLPCDVDAYKHEREVGAVPVDVRRLSPLQSKCASFVAKSWVALWAKFHIVLRKVKPDLIHAGPVQSGGFLAALSGFHPLLIMSWGSDILALPKSSRWMRRVTRFTLQRADAILVDCMAVRDEAIQLAKIPLERFICFPWGIELEHFGPKVPILGLRGRLGWQGCQVVVSARSFEPIHDTLTILEAMRRVFETYPHARLLLLGDGSLRPRVEAYISEHNLKDKVCLAGGIPEATLPDYFAEADLYISAGLSDGSSISLLQAMGCRLPVVAPDIGGNREWVTSGVNGWLYPAGDARALESVTGTAMNNIASWRILGEGSLEIARARADWSSNFPQLLTAYKQLVARAPAIAKPAYAQLQNR
jgi:glycosyltransferase involved in cell wall biosynthesis